MRNRVILIGIYMLVISAAFLIIYSYRSAVTAMTENADTAYTIVIDAGHGEPDGGAVSCTGLSECIYNLEISKRLKDLLNLVGHKARLTRTNAYSIYTSGNTIAEKKVSDLKERVRIVRDTHNPLLVSIHQNQFSDGIYSGAVVLYGQHADSKRLADSIQSYFIQYLNPGSKRSSKPAEGVYLMQHVSCPAVLVECGFLSNRQEEAKLRSPEYQKKICCILVSSVSEYLVQQTHSIEGKI